MSGARIVIVGAGQAGGCAARSLRAAGHAGPIVLIGDEPHPPHERPPLSKAVLSGTAAPEVTHLFKPEAFAALGLDFRPRTRVERIDRAARRIDLAGGGAVAYDRLILATGGRARRLALPGGERALVLRSIEDSLAIGRTLGTRARLAVIGGGWIGLEVAASARKRGAAVTVIEALPRLCARTLPEATASFLQARHEREGVAFRLGAGIGAIEDGAVRLADGETIAADLVVAGIGLEPETALARACGLAVENGIVVDERCASSDPAIFAAGDCANAPLACIGRRVRLESWANAQAQAAVAAKAALGLDARYDELPWFWSDQYDVNLQILGLPERWSEPVRRGDPAKAGFTDFHLADGRIVAAIAVNAPRDLRAARRLIEGHVPVRAEQLADPAVNLAKL